MATSATMVARRITLFIQSSFCFLYLQAACTCLLQPRSTHSVQNQNVKVFIILMIFNKSVTRVFHRESVGGGRRIRTFGRFTASGFQDQRIRPLCHAPSLHVWWDYTISGSFHLRVDRLVSRETPATSGQCSATSRRSRNPKRSSQFGGGADVVQDAARAVRLAGLAGA